MVQPFETGVVRAIRVQDGQSVKAGDVLIELDPTVNAAERDHLTTISSPSGLTSRGCAPRSRAPRPCRRFVAPADADPVLVSTQRQLLANQVSEHRAKIASLSRQQAQKEAEHETIGHHPQAGSADPRDPAARRYPQNADGEGDRLEAHLRRDPQFLAQQQEELNVQMSHQHEAEAAVAAIRETRAKAVAEYSKGLSDDLAKSEQKVNGPAQDLIKAQQKTRLQQLTSPVDGVGQQLAVHTVGGVVTPAQSLLVIAPDDNALEIEAMVSTATSASSQAEDKPPKIKIDTFNFTRYGLLHGEVVSVSQDAIIRDRPPERARMSERLAHSTTPVSRTAQEFNYNFLVSLD